MSKHSLKKASQRTRKHQAFGEAGVYWYAKNLIRLMLKELKYSVIKTPRHFSSPLVILFEPRSGSTWLVEMLSSLNGFVIAQDPLIERNGFAYAARYGYSLRPMYFNSDEMTEVKPYLDDIFSLKRGGCLSLDSAGLLTENPVSTTVVKFANTPWVAQWFRHHYDANVIALVRDPISTIRSQMNFFRTQQKLEYCLQHSEVLATLPKSAIDLMHRAVGRDEFTARLITLFVRWYPLFDDKGCGTRVVRYEDLLAGKLASLDFLEGLQDDWAEVLLQNALKPSRSTAIELGSIGSKKSFERTSQEQRALETVAAAFGAESTLERWHYL